MEYGDVFISDDGTRVVKWVSIKNIASEAFRCSKCALFDTRCTITGLEGWTKLVADAKARHAAIHSCRDEVCVEGMFVELDPLEMELVKVGGG